MNNPINIHPIINKLNISTESKEYFTKYQFYEIIDSPILLDSTNILNEARENLWSFSVDKQIVKTNIDDLENFYFAIIEAREFFIKNHYSNMKMKFYTWYDSMAGNFYLSLISSVEQELPFKAKIVEVDSLEEVITEFFKDNYCGVLSLNDMSLNLEKDCEQKLCIEDPPLKVWSIILPTN